MDYLHDYGFHLPIAIILTKDSFVSDKPEEDAGDVVASDASEEEAAPRMPDIDNNF